MRLIWVRITRDCNNLSTSLILTLAAGDVKARGISSSGEGIIKWASGSRLLLHSWQAFPPRIQAQWLSYVVLLLLQGSTSCAQMYRETGEGRGKPQENCLLRRITRWSEPSSSFPESGSNFSTISLNFTSQCSFTSPFPLLILTDILKKDVLRFFIFFNYSFWKTNF